MRRSRKKYQKWVLLGWNAGAERRRRRDYAEGAEKYPKWVWLGFGFGFGWFGLVWVCAWRFYASQPYLRHSRAGGNLCFVLNAALDSRLRGNDGIYLSALYCRSVPPFCPIHFWCFLRLLRNLCALCVLPPCCNALCGALCVCLATGFVRLAARLAIGGVIRVAIRCSFRVVAASLRCRRFAGIV